MKKLTKLIVAAGVATSALAAQAQTNTYSGYFLENYTYRHQMNPAFGNEDSEHKGFVGFPLLGNINLGMRGNLHLQDIVYNRNGKTMLFTNPAISAKEAMNKFHDKNRLGFGFKFDIINFGFKAWGGYNTFGINLKGDVEASLPKSFFSLVKEGVENKTYDIENLRANAGAYAEIALNHSRDIKQVPGLRVGAAVKILLGLGNIEAEFNKAHLRLGKNSWDITANADLYGSVKGLKFKHDYNETADREYVSGLDFDGFGLNGFGLAFDLGAEYKWRDFRFSAALLDLGFINWNSTAHASTDGTVHFKTSDYTFDVDSDDDRDAFDDMKDDLTAIYQLQDKGNAGSRTTGLAATLNLGVNYELPYYRRLTFGLLNSTRIYGPMTWTEFRLSANVMPVDVFSANVNVACGTYGWAFGWLLNLKLHRGFNLFVGMDHCLGTLSKQGIPLNSNAKVNFGIDFPF